MSIDGYAMALEGLVLSAALDAKAIAPCPFHSDEIMTNGDPDADRRAYAFATRAWKFEGAVFEREEVMEAMKGLLEMTDEECPRCEDNWNA